MPQRGSISQACSVWQLGHPVTLRSPLRDVPATRLPDEAVAANRVVVLQLRWVDDLLGQAKTAQAGLDGIDPESRGDGEGDRDPGVSW